MNIIEKAIQFATKAHEGTCRKGTSLPYILHPLEAGAIAAQIADDPEVIAASVLHDVVELYIIFSEGKNISIKRAYKLQLSI